MGNRRFPAAMDRVEFHQQRVLLGIAYGVVEKDDVAADAGIDQVAQDKLADTAKAVECDAGHWVQPLVWESALMPIWSTCVCSARRVSDSNGSSTKAAIRRRSAP